MHKKTKNLPLPRRGRALCERGLGGIGGRIKTKGVGGRRQRGQAPRRVALTQVEPVPRPIQPRGCKGRSPLHKKTKNLPLPRRGRALCERGLGGIGGRIKTKGVGGRRQRGQAPRRVALTQVEPVPRPIQPRGCKGRSPLHKKTKNLPLPAGKGVGGMGAKRKGKAGTTGGKEGKPPRGGANTHRAGDGWGKPPRRYRISRGKCKIYEKA